MGRIHRATLAQRSFVCRFQRTSVPNLGLDSLSINVDAPGGELDTDSRLGLEVELVASETRENWESQPALLSSLSTQHVCAHGRYALRADPATGRPTLTVTVREGVQCVGFGQEGGHAISTMHTKVVGAFEHSQYSRYGTSDSPLARALGRN